MTITTIATLIPLLAALTLTLGLALHTRKQRRTYQGTPITTRQGLNPNNTTPTQNLETLAKNIKPTTDYHWQWYQ